MWTSFSARAQTFEERYDFLVRDGGRWVAQGGGGFETFHNDFTWTFNRQAFTFSIYGVTATGDTTLFWQGLQGQDIRSGSDHITQHGNSGFIGLGPSRRADPELYINEITFYFPAEVSTTDSLFVTGPDSFTIRSYEEGVFSSESSWERVSTTSAQEYLPTRAQHSLLHPNHPNPFGSATTITYSLDRPGAVTLEVFDMRGRLVRRLLDHVAQPAGDHTLEWDGRDAAGQPVSTGVYSYRLRTPSGVETRRLTAVR